MGSTPTPIHGYRYPDPGSAPDGPAAFADLADDLDASTPIVTATEPAKKHGLVWHDPTTGVTQITDGVTWMPLSFLLHGGASPLAGSLPAGQVVPLLQAGCASVTTDASSIAVFSWPVAFPNGLLGVTLTTLIDTVTQLRLVQGACTATQCMFVARTTTGAGAASTALSVSYVAIGW